MWPTIGLERELELATLEAAIGAARRGVSASEFLHLNVSPELILRGTELRALLSEVPHGLVLEITEHADRPGLRGVPARRGAARAARCALQWTTPAPGSRACGTSSSSIRHS